MPVRTFATDKDAYVDEGSPDTSFGGSLSLYVRFQGSLLGGNDRETLVGFDLSSLFDDADVLDILSATLRIPPVAADDGGTIEAYDVDASAWTEGGVTWNNKPARGTLQSSEATGDSPHEWDVIDEVDAGFNDDTQDRVGFILVMQDGLSGEEFEVDYDAREASGTDHPRLELETHEQRRTDLSSDVEVSKSGAGDLDSFVEVKFFHERWLGGRLDELVDADGNAYQMNDVAWDPSLGQFWAIERGARALVHRHDRDGAHDAAFQVHEDGAQLSKDLQSIAVADDGNVFVGIDSGDFDTDGDVVECTVDEMDTTLDVATRNSAHSLSPNWITFDGTRVWILEFFDGKVEERHPSNWALNRSGSIGSGDAYRGIARADDHGQLVLFKDTAGEIELQDPDDLGTVQDTVDKSEDVNTAEGLAFRGRSWFGALFVADSGNTGSQVWTYAPRELDSQVLIPTEGSDDLDATVQPGSIPGSSDLASQVATGSSADLSSTVTPRVDGSGDLDSTVQPASLTSSADVDALVEVQAVPITDDHKARARGRVAPTVVVDEVDMGDVSGEVGSAITVNPDGQADDLRRVVHLLDGESSYPKARADPSSDLDRGDAVLYAKSGDAFQVGDIVAWQGVDWKVDGLLGWEMVGDSQLYQEVALRRQAIVHEARATGTVS